MNEQIFFDYLAGEWLIEREIIDKPSSTLAASASGCVSITKKNKDILNYQELLKVKWANGFVSSSNQQYDYILDSTIGRIGLYNYNNESRSFMFNLVFDLSLNIVSGQYQCGLDIYYATYEIINYNQFILIFQVNGMEKDCSIISCFRRIE